jgi:hypothetical protein
MVNMPNADTLPTYDDRTGPCPRCGRAANFQAFAEHRLQPPDSTQSERVVLLRCMGCRVATVVVEQLRPDDGGWVGIHWWPTPGTGQLDPGVSPAVASAYEEGMRCLAAGAPRAAAVMFRRALAEIVADKGSADARAGGTLFEQLTTTEPEGSLHPSLVEWAKETRVLVNAGADPSALASVSQLEAADLARFTRQMIEVVYEVPARILRARTLRDG